MVLGEGDQPGLELPDGRVVTRAQRQVEADPQRVGAGRDPQVGGAGQPGLSLLVIITRGHHRVLHTIQSTRLQDSLP